MRKLTILLLFVSLGTFGQFLRPANVAMHWTPNQTFPAGLVAYYSFDEGSGSTLYDESGNSHDGTITGATWTTDGKYGGALVFDGIDDEVVVPDTDALDLGSGKMTLSAWVYPTQIDGAWTAIFQKGTDAYFLHADTPYGVPAGGGTLGGTCCPVALASVGLSEDTWNHVALTYDGAQLVYYVNGSVSGTKTASGAIEATASALRIGKNTYSNEEFEGRIDEARVYDRALSATEIQSDM